MSPYASEVTEQIRQEVRVHGPRAVAEALNVSESCIREIAPRESWEHDNREERGCNPK
jgi:hypothetical protein